MPLTDIDGRRLGDSVGDKLGNRNLFINGAATVAQRGTSLSSVTTGGAGNQTVDLFRPSITSLGTWTLSQASDGPDGFANSFKVDCTTADASPSSGDLIAIDCYLEAQNLQALNYGNAGAVAATLSFYVKSNKTGSGTVSILQSDNSNRCINVSYTISSANTWERKTISLPADASGLINDDNGRGLAIEFWLNSGSTYTGGSAQTTWGTLTNANRNFANLGIGGSTDDVWQITGVQLELGNTATPFEHRTFSEELRRCQRYFSRSYEYGTAAGTSTNSGATVSVAYSAIAYAGHTSFFPVSMRATPSITVYGSGGTINVVNADSSEGPSNVGFIGHDSCVVNRNNDNTGVGANVFIRSHFLASAEL